MGMFTFCILMTVLSDRVMELSMNQSFIYLSPFTNRLKLCAVFKSVPLPRGSQTYAWMTNGQQSQAMAIMALSNIMNNTSLLAKFP
jgi:hypothetical protein